MAEVPHLYFSRRRMLNRLSFTPQSIHDLKDAATGQDTPSALACLLALEALGLAQRSSGKGWRITDVGVVAMAANGPTYSET